MRVLRSIWVAVLLLAGSVAASAQTVTAIVVMESASATEVEVKFDRSARKASKIFAISEDKPRLVLDFKGVNHAINQENNRISGAGFVKAIRFAQRGDSQRDLRLVIDLASADVRHVSRMRGDTLAITLGSNVSGKSGLTDSQIISTKARLEAAPIALRYFKNETPYPRIKPGGSLAVPPRPARKPVIVIDPGHGGNDPGAIGVAGTLEKKITWAASLELKKQLEATGRYTVLMTRSSDVYVAHDERLRIARAGGADLFLSIHADATASGSARGASVYTLADRAINRSKRIVNTQNWIMDVDLSEQSDPVGDILVDLAQRKTASQSDEFAELLITKLSKSTRLIGNTHRRAGYFVLLAPDVPAVLLELGFLSNADDEALLNQEVHRKKVITSVTRAINLHFDKQKS